MGEPFNPDWGGRGRGPRGRWGNEAWAGLWQEWWRGPAPRAERGAVRWLVLDAVAAQARHGYEVIQAIGEKSGGAYKPSPGVVYPALQMLEELGLVTTLVRSERKAYGITAAGLRELELHAAEVSDFYDTQKDSTWDQHADDVAHVMKRLVRVVSLFKRAMHRGGVRPATMRKARGILDEALEKLENLLSPEQL